MAQVSLDFLREQIPPLHKAGYPFVAIFALVALLLGFLSGYLLMLGVILTAWCAYFFRDPERTPPLERDAVISPADGKIILIEQVTPPKELELPEATYQRVSIFLNVFDVHVNRVPTAGKIVASHYHAGAFLNAAFDKASDENERQLLTIERADGVRIGFVQIAGWIARRILCDAKPGMHFTTAERYGIIRFGSRADVYIPQSATLNVRVGQRAVGGETVLAHVAIEESLPEYSASATHEGAL